MSKTNYSRRDFARLRYDVYKLRKGGKLKFDDLENYKIFSRKLPGGLDNVLIFKWVVYMYDINSPFNDITDIRKRSVIAASEANFSKNHAGRFLDSYADVITFRGDSRPIIGKMILQYCRLQRDSDYTQLAVYENVRARNNELLLSPDTDIGEMKNLIAAQNILEETINTLRKKFLNGDDSDKTYQEIINSIENEIMEFSPEKIAKNEEIRRRVERATPYKLYNGDKFSYKDLTPEERQDLKNELTNNTEECKRHFEALGIDYKDFTDGEI